MARRSIEARLRAAARRMTAVKLPRSGCTTYDKWGAWIYVDKLGIDVCTSRSLAIVPWRYVAAALAARPRRKAVKRG